MGDVQPLRREPPAMAAYRSAERSKAEAAQKVFDAMLQALNVAEACCSDAAAIELPPGIKDLARRMADQIAEAGLSLQKINGNTAR